MLITTKLRFSSIISVLLMTVFIVAVFFLTSALRQSYAKQQVAEKIHETSFELILLRNEYVTYPSARPKAQWISAYQTHARLLDQSRELFSDPAEKPVYGDIIAASDETKILFEELVRAVEQGGSATVIQELNNQLSMKAQARIEDAVRLENRSHQSATLATNAFVSVVFVLGLLVVCMSLGSYAISNTIAGSIRALAKGIKDISAGNFDRRIPVQGQDEIGALARSFETMARSVQESQRDLEQKVRERTSDVQKFQQAVESSTEAIAITYPDLRYVYVNPAWEKLTGYSAQDISSREKFTIVKRLSDRTDLDTAEHLHALSMGVQDTEHASFSSEDLVLKRKDGSEYNAELHLFPIRENGKIIFFVNIHSDITARKRVETAKTEFISLASHQLRTPLTTIRWIVDMFRKGKAGDLSDFQKELMDNAKQAADRMAESIRTMLSISHVDTETVQLERGKLDMHDELERLRQEMQPLLSTHAQECTIECPAGLTFSSDQGIVREILSNLLSNAIKYTQDKGHIVLRARKITGGVQCTIEDDGCGIPRHQQDKVFTKFFRADNVAGMKTQGTGLGLYLVYNLVKKLGSTVSFTSEEGKGTTFTVHFRSLPTV